MHVSDSTELWSNVGVIKRARAGGARLEKLAIDLKAQAAYVDVFSPMVYHARFGHAGDLAWISRQVDWLGEYLGVKGASG